MWPSAGRRVLPRGEVPAIASLRVRVPPFSPTNRKPPPPIIDLRSPFGEKTWKPRPVPSIPAPQRVRPCLCFQDERFSPTGFFTDLTLGLEGFQALETEILSSGHTTVSVRLNVPESQTDFHSDPHTDTNQNNVPYEQVQVLTITSEVNWVVRSVPGSAAHVT